MGVAAKDRLSAEARRRSLLDAARAVFGRRGYVATSIDDVVGEAGVSPPVLYDHFSSKRELYIELLSLQNEELLARISQAAEGKRGGRTRLRASYAAFFALVEEQPFTYRMIAGEDGGDPEVAAAVRMRDAEGRRRVAEVLGATGTLYADRPDRELSIEIMAQMLRHGLNGLALWWRAHPETPAETLVDRAIDLTWVGLQRLRN